MNQPANATGLSLYTEAAQRASAEVIEERITQVIERQVEQVKTRIHSMIEHGLRARGGVFA